MLPAASNLSMARLISRYVILTATLALAAVPSLFPLRAQAPTTTEIIPVSEVRAGMKGYAYTIFAGDQVEKFDLEVIGVMPNFLGPRQSIILIELKGPKVEHTGVVAGMSGSPVYLEGKLAGALSLKLGIFTKEAIAGVTPIEDVLRPPTEAPPAAPFAGATNSAAQPNNAQPGAAQQLSYQAANSLPNLNLANGSA